MEDFLSIVWNTERVFMIDFGRAKTGPSHRRFPEIDDVGYHDLASPHEHGPITSAMAGQERVTVRLHRMEISQRAKLFAVPGDPGILTITKPANGALTQDLSQNIEFTAGSSAGRTSIDIRYNWPDGPVLGRLYVQVYEKIQVRMRLHIVTLVQRSGAGAIVKRNPPPNPFFGKHCPTTASKLAHVRTLVNDANETWTPHGIVFVIDDVCDTVWGQEQLGSASIDPLDSIALRRAGALSPNRSATHVNVYCLPDFGAAGMGIQPALAKLHHDVYSLPPTPALASPPEHSPCALHLDATARPDRVGQTIAHEMGHYMTLWHSGFDINERTQLRDDSVSRRRLMYLADGLLDAKSTPWRHDIGYGNLTAGGFLTYRRLFPGQDVTFEESQRARDAALAPGFYSA